MSGAKRSSGQRHVRYGSAERCSIPRSVGVLVRALGGGDRGQGRLLLAVTMCSAIGEYAFVALGGALGIVLLNQI